MKKFSELLGQRDIEASSPQPTQSLVLFDSVLSGEKLIHLPEIETLVNHFYGGLALTLAQTELAEQLHDLTIAQ